MRVATIALALYAVSSVSAAPIPGHDRRSGESIEALYPRSMLESRNSKIDALKAALESDLAGVQSKLPKEGKLYHPSKIAGATSGMQQVDLYRLKKANKIRAKHEHDLAVLMEQEAKDAKKKKWIIVGVGGTGLLGGTLWYRNKQQQRAAICAQNPDPQLCPNEWAMAQLQGSGGMGGSGMPPMGGQPAMMPVQGMPGMGGQMPVPGGGMAGGDVSGGGMTGAGMSSAGMTGGDVAAGGAAGGGMAGGSTYGSGATGGSATGGSTYGSGATGGSSYDSGTTGGSADGSGATGGSTYGSGTSSSSASA